MSFWEMLTINLLSHWGMRMCWVFFFTRKGIKLYLKEISVNCTMKHVHIHLFFRNSQCEHLISPVFSVLNTIQINYSAPSHSTCKGPKVTKQKSFSKKWYIHIMPNCFTNNLCVTNIIPPCIWSEGVFCWLNEVINYLLWLKTFLITFDQ